MTAMVAAATAAAGEVAENAGGRERGALVVDNGPVQVSEQDDRAYRHITLPNQMQASLSLSYSKQQHQ